METLTQRVCSSGMAHVYVESTRLNQTITDKTSTLTVLDRVGKVEQRLIDIVANTSSVQRYHQLEGRLSTSPR